MKIWGIIREAFTFSDLSRGERIGLALLLGAIAVFPWVVKDGFARTVAVQFLYYAMLGLSWNFIGGYGGQIDLGGAKNVGFGAYGVALPMVLWDWPFWLGLPIGVAFAVLESLVLGLGLLRLRGHYFAIGTLAVALVWEELFVYSEWTRGARGLLLPFKRAPDYLYMQLTPVGFHYFIAALFVFSLLWLNWFRRSKLGYQLRAIREDEDAAASLGINVLAAKVKAYCISSVVAALGGAFYAVYYGFIDPDSVMHLDLSIMIAMTALVGGAGVLWGPIVGAAVLIPLDRYLGAWFGGGGILGMDFLIYAVIIMLLAAYQPKGVAGLIEALVLWRLKATGRSNAGVRAVGGR
ncbi:MAG: hypothetical protein DIU82_05925 [Bacillota bacterium]|nr:MAG: hypothetical protein DIU82_05925 [Bacillota bacterium]